jgi:hypothetical protein
MVPERILARLGAAIITAVTLLNLLEASKLSRLESVLAAVKYWHRFFHRDGVAAYVRLFPGPAVWLG